MTSRRKVRACDGSATGLTGETGAGRETGAHEGTWLPDDHSANFRNFRQLSGAHAKSRPGPHLCASAGRATNPAR
jgi:hypothetical protein